MPDGAASRTGGGHAPTPADTPARAGAAGDRHRGGVPRAVSAARPAGAGLPGGGAVAAAGAAAAVLRADLAHRGDGGAVHVPGPVGRQRVRRAAAHRAVPGPPLRDHAVVPRPAVPVGHEDLPGTGQRGRAGTHAGRAGRPAGPAGHRAQQPRRARRLVPAGPPAAHRVRPPPAGGHEGGAAARPRPGRDGQPAAERVHLPPHAGERIFTDQIDRLARGLDRPARW